MYSRGYDFVSGQDFTDLGKAVHKYKYYKNLTSQERDKILTFCVEHVKQAFQKNFGQALPFNFLVAVPPNRMDSNSLPPLIVKSLAGQSGGALIDASKLLTKKKEIPVLKNLDSTEKAKALEDAYFFNPNLPDQRRGILIVDDIFDSGATLRFVARAINGSYPDVPRYVLTLTALKGNYE